MGEGHDKSSHHSPPFSHPLSSLTTGSKLYKWYYSKGTTTCPTIQFLKHSCTTRRAKSLFRLGFDHLRHLILNPSSLNFRSFLDSLHFLSCTQNRNSNSEFLSEKGLAIAYSSRDSGFGFKENNPSLIEQRYSGPIWFVNKEGGDR